MIPQIDKEGRVHGFAKNHIRNKRYFFLSDVQGIEYCAHDNDCVAGTPGGHICLLTRRTEVNFIAVSDSKCSGKWRAEDVRLTYPPTLPEKEESVISSWSETFGWALRDCSLNCHVFVHQNFVLSDLNRPLQPGDHLLHRTVETTKKNGKPSWQAIDIDVYS